MGTLESIIKLAGEIGLSQTDLLGLTREVAHDKTLLSIGHLTKVQRELLLAQVMVIEEQMLVAL